MSPKFDDIALFAPPLKKCKRGCSSCRLVENTGAMNAPRACKLKGVVYAMLCNCCNKLYVGQTKNIIIKRILIHISTINNMHTNHSKNKWHYELSKKINHKGENGSSPRFIVLAYNIRKSKVRLQEEKAFMDILHTQYPNGLNVRPFNHCR